MASRDRAAASPYTFPTNVSSVMTTMAPEAPACLVDAAIARVAAAARSTAPRILAQQALNIITEQRIC